MLSALARRRSLVLVIAVAVALAAVGAPAVAGEQGHCLTASDQHCPPALLGLAPIPTPSPLGLVESHDGTLSPPMLVTLVFKVPLTF